MPASASSRPVRRVSSQAMTSASSERRGGPGGEVRQVPDGRGDQDQGTPLNDRDLEVIARAQVPRAKAPASLSRTQLARRTGEPDTVRRHGRRADDLEVAVAVGDVDREPDAERVDRAGRPQEQGAVDALPADQNSRALRRQSRREVADLEAMPSTSSSRSSQGTRASQTLKRISRTSPSWTS